MFIYFSIFKPFGSKLISTKDNNAQLEANNN